MKKYRLKRDTPEFKAGEVFEMIHNIDVGDVLTQNAPRQDMYAFEVDSIDNFDEWFEEVKREYRRSPIKLVRFDKPDGKYPSGTIFVRVNFVFVKTFYFEDSEYSICSSKEGEDDYINFTTNENDAPTWDKWHQDNVNYINQLVRDGYIKIEDNPNIVWEDSDEN